MRNLELFMDKPVERLLSELSDGKVPTQHIDPSGRLVSDGASRVRLRAERRAGIRPTSLPAHRTLRVGWGSRA
jgi:hypothetical protein